MSEEKVTSTRRRRRSPKKVQTSEPSLKEVVTKLDGPPPEDDSLKPIRFKKENGPNLGVDVYMPEGDVSFFFISPANGQKLNIPTPIAIKTKRQGQESYRIEFYYELNEVEISMDRFDGAMFLLQTGFNEKTKKKVGKRFKSLVCIGRGYDRLDQISSDRLVKYVCQTDYENFFGDIPRNLPNLGSS